MKHMSLRAGAVLVGLLAAAALFAAPQAIAQAPISYAPIRPAPSVHFATAGVRPVEARAGEGGAIDLTRRPAPIEMARPSPAQRTSAPAHTGAPWLLRERVGQPYEINGRWYAPQAEPGYERTGIASWYGPTFHGRPTATGETYDQENISAAHPTLPIPSLVQVTNLENGRELILRVNDRGPFVDDRLIDLSHGAAQALGFVEQGTARVHVRYLGPAPRRPTMDASAVAPPARSVPPVAAPISFTPPAAPAPAVISAPISAPAHGTAVIQIGAFGDEAVANRVRDDLAEAGTVTVDTVFREGRPLYRVRVSGFQDRNAAESAWRAVQARGYPDARLTM